MASTAHSTSSRRPPARINRILKVLRCRKAGMAVAEAPWQAYQFQNKEFDDLILWLKRDEELWGYVEDKVRYDYDSERSSLVSRRPTMLHNCFVSLVAQEVIQNLNTIANGDDPIASAFAKKVCPMDSSRINLLGSEKTEREQKMIHNPDFSFKHVEAAWPGVIFELSYPSKRRIMPFLADDYILETGGQVCVMVGLHLDSQTKMASVSTWQPLFKEDEHGVVTELEAALVQDDELFRDRYGNPNQDPKSGLHLNLKDFGPEYITNNLESGIPISISSMELCALLARAEAAHQNNISHRTKDITIRKRRKSQIDSDSEASEDETSRLDKVAAADSSTKRVKISVKTKSCSPEDGEVQISNTPPIKNPHPDYNTSKAQNSKE